MYDRRYYALSGIEYKRATELLGDMWNGKVYVNVIEHHSRPPFLSEIRLAQSLVRGQSEIVDKPSCLKMLLQLVTIISSYDTNVTNLYPEALAVYLQKRKSTIAFWYVTQAKTTKAAWLNAVKTVHEYKLVDKMQNMYTTRSYVDRKLKQKDLFAALKPGSNSLRQSMVESIEKLIEHYEQDKPGRSQPQLPRPKNPHERRGGNHSGRPNKKYVDRVTNSFDKMRDKLETEIMPRGDAGARRDARRGLNSLQRAMDVHNGRYTNTEAARAALPTPPDTPIRSPARFHARSSSRSSPKSVFRSARSSPRRSLYKRASISCIH